jgi:hypothetical protein
MTTHAGEFLSLLSSVGTVRESLARVRSQHPNNKRSIPRRRRSRAWFAGS